MSLLRRLNFPYRYVVIGAIFLLWFTIYFQRVNISVLLVDPRFVADMGLVGQGARQGLLMTLFLLVYAASNMLAAPLGDRIGPRKTIIIAVLLSSLAMLGGGLAQSFAMMLAARVVLGLSQGIHFPSQNILVNNWFPPSERGLANGIYGVGGCLGPLLAIPIFTIMVNHYSWEWTFFLVAVMGGIFCIPFLIGIVTDHPDHNKYINESEKRFLCQGEAPVQKNKISWSVVGKVMASLDFWLAAVSYMAYLSIWWGIITWLPQYLTVARGFSMQALAQVGTLPYAVAIIGVVGGGYVSDHVSRRVICCFIGLALASGFILAAAYAPSKMACIIYISLAVGAVQFYWAPVWAFLQTMLPDEVMGTCSGVINGVGNLVSAAAPVIIGYLIQTTQSYEAGLLYLVIFGAVGAVCSLILLRRPVWK